MALRQDAVRLLIADDVGIGKTIEAGLIAAELLAQGDVAAARGALLPALAEQWQRELRDKFGIDAALVLTSTVKAPRTRPDAATSRCSTATRTSVVSTDFIKSDRRRHEFLRRCPDLVIVDEAHNCVADGGRGRQRPATSATSCSATSPTTPSRHLVLSPPPRTPATTRPSAT